MLAVERENLCPEGAVPILALRPRQAAQALGISERTLWQYTADGEIPHVRLGGRVLYSVESLRQWLADRQTPRDNEKPRSTGV